ncbi:MAG: ABC transporter ATP-binding protein [Burkholderiaceae bacterium]
MTILHIDRLRSGYRQIPILHGVSLALDEGEFLGILGHNGMGKSTLLKTISGELPLTGGDVALNGRSLNALPQYRRARLGIGYVPQGRRIFPGISVRQNLEVGALAAGQPVDIVDTVVADFPRLASILDRPGGVLSGGEQQILALARCLCGQPKVILLDEPTEGIQPSIRDEIIDTLQALRRRRPLTMLLVEQNIDFIQRLSDRVLSMVKGTLGPAHPSGAHDAVDL